MGWTRRAYFKGYHLEQLTAPSEPTFAGLKLVGPVERISGGYETDVFRSGDGRLALKLKHLTGTAAAMLFRARRLRQVAELFQEHLAPAHSLPSDYLIIAGADGASHVLAVQPFLADARPLDTVDLDTWSASARAALVVQLSEIVAGALACYQASGYLPDVYGLSPHDGAQARRWDPRWLLRVGWRMLAGRPLITAHNLMLTLDGRVVLVDYDPICHDRPICRLVYAARALLLWRDQRQIAAIARAAATGGSQAAAPEP